MTALPPKSLLPALVAVTLALPGCAARRSDSTVELLRALDQKEEAAALKALADGADAKARESRPAPFDPQGRGHTALYLAMRIHSRRLVGELIARGADVNERYEAGATPLMQAVALQNPEAAAVLLENGADVRPQASDGSTALHYACLTPGDRLTRLLVEHGAPVNVRDRAGNTPLALAKARKNEAAARFLQSHGGKE